MSRFTIDLGPEFEETLASLALQRGTTKAEVIRRAIITYTTLKNEEMEGNRVSIVGYIDDSDELKRVKDIILP